MFAVVLALLAVAPATAQSTLEDQLGRNEVRVWSGPFQVEPGTTVSGASLDQRLQRRGYQRVRGRRPQEVGEYFWGHQRFWIYRRAHRLGGRRIPAQLLLLRLDRRTGTVLSVSAGEEQPRAWLEPVLLAESLEANRARRELVSLHDLPEHVWQPLIAVEDARFFEHSGVDSRAVARALLANLKAGGVAQGGSTLTQQLIKVRDLSPRRSLGRKVSEAARALALEAEYDKQEILQAYLNAVYFGHLDGVHIYGLGAASRAYFSKPAKQLSLAEAALLAGIIQGPNRLSPLRNPERALARYRTVLARVQAVGWAQTDELARRGLPRLRPKAPPVQGPKHFLDWLQQQTSTRSPRRQRKGRGVVVESSLDAHLQARAEQAVRQGLDRLRQQHRRLRGQPLSAAAVLLDSRDGRVLAYVGGDPARSNDAFDRARRARRQPGSAVKPLILLEAFGRCGGQDALYPGRRISDRPLRLELPSGPWEPRNPDGRNRNAVTIEEATLSSLNLPFVRIARHCGFAATAKRLRRSGLDLPQPTAPSFVLGAVETSPLALAEAYAGIATLGRQRRAKPMLRLESPGGRLLSRGVRQPRRRAAPAAAAYLTRDLLRRNALSGTARPLQDAKSAPWAKTGTSSDGRDAWLAGGSGPLVLALWVGLDDGTLGLSAAEAALPIWTQILEAAAPSFPPTEPGPPPAIEEHWVELKSGLRVRSGRAGAKPYLFRRGALPPHRRFWREDRPIPVLD